MKTELIKSTRANMRSWAMHWRQARALHDKQGMAVAKTRAVIWRETSVTLQHQQSNN